MKVRGNLNGIRDTIIEQLDLLYEIEISKTNFASRELVNELSRLTETINKEISVYIDRFGNVIDVAVGDDKSVELQDMSRRRGVDRLSGIRCIHTHPNGDSRLSSVDVNALLSLRFDGMCAIGVEDGNCKSISIGYIEVIDGSLSEEIKMYTLKPSSIENQKLMEIVYDTENSIDLTNALYNLEEKPEKAILVGVKLQDDDFPEEESIDELEDLAKSAGAEVIHKIIQSKSKVDRAFYIGSGKAEELRLVAQSLNADLIIFDHELSPIQLKNLEMSIGIKVIDRTTLILDIFAQRAQSNEGKLQVELAQLKFRLPRLLGIGTMLSQQGGGIGSKGPGEKKLETDRRHIMRKIEQLQKEIKDNKKNREVQRKRRHQSGIPAISLVGYTNAGKSTLLNTLCDSDVLAEDKLFATLDPTTRKLEMDDGQNFLFTDTVGFVSKLPHYLVEAFKSTLEETIHADLLVHVIDVSNSAVEYQISTVLKVLEELGVKDTPIVTVLNKVDKLENKEIIDKLKDQYSDSIIISAKKNEGLDDLLKAVKDRLGINIKEIELTIPYDKAYMENKVREVAKVLSTEYKENNISLKIAIGEGEMYKIREFIS